MNSHTSLNNLMFNEGATKCLPFSQFLSSIEFDKDVDSCELVNDVFRHYLILEYLNHLHRSKQDLALPSPFMELNFSLQNFVKDTYNHYRFSMFWSVNYIKSLGCLIKQDRDTLSHYQPLLKLKEQGFVLIRPFLDVILIEISDHLFVSRTLSDGRVQFYVTFLLDLLRESNNELVNFNAENSKNSFYFSLPTFINLIDIILASKQYDLFTRLYNLACHGNGASIIKFKLLEHLQKYNLNVENIHTKSSQDTFSPLEGITLNSLFEDIKKFYLESEDIPLSGHRAAITPDYINYKIALDLSSDKYKNFHLEKMPSYLRYLQDTADSKRDNLSDSTLSWMQWVTRSEDKYEEYPVMKKWMESSFSGPIAFPPIFHLCQSPVEMARKDKKILLHDSIPFIFKLYLTPHSLNLYQIFWHKFEKLNQLNNERYRIDYASFIFKNQIKFINLYEIMQDNLFPFLNSSMATSTLNIDRFFNSFQSIKGEWYKFFCELFILPKKLKHDEVKNILLFPGIITELGDPDAEQASESLKKLIAHIRKMQSLYEIQTFLNKYIIELYCKNLHVPHDENMDIFKIMAELPLQSLCLLLIARRELTGNNYQSVFDELIKVDLSQHLSFNNFTMNIKQDSDIGKALARHNCAIARKLKSAGIDTKKAFNYTLMKRFSFGSNIASILLSTWQDITQLEAITQKLPAKTIKICALENMIGKFISGISKTQPNAFLKIKNESNLRFLEKILNLCHLVINESRQHGFLLIKSENLQTAFNNCVNNLNTNFLNLSQSLETNTDKIRSIQRFRVQQWDKEKISTFFLGNYLSCCLATNGSGFSALIQRRMDKAMFMHVVIDEQSGEPICGNWLFFAENAGHLSNDIFVVANYFEIRTNYVENRELRDLLITELIRFTAEFTAEIHARDFLMRPLTYGFIPDFDYYQFNCTPIRIKKVGGYLQLKNKTSRDEYYLHAVDLDSFYTYTNSTYPTIVNQSKQQMYTYKIQHFEELINTLNAIPQENHWATINLYKNIIQNENEILLLARFIPAENFLEFCELFIHLIKNANDAQFIFSTLNEKDRFPFIINHQNLIHDGYELANTIKYLSEKISILDFVKTQRNKIKNGYQLAKVIFFLKCSDDHIKFTLEERYKIKDRTQLLAVSEQLPENYREKFEQEQKILWATHSFSLFSLNTSFVKNSKSPPIEYSSLKKSL